MSVLLWLRGCVRNNGTTFVEFILDCTNVKYMSLLPVRMLSVSSMDLYKRQRVFQTMRSFKIPLPEINHDIVHIRDTDSFIRR